ncbi:DUF924 family protein [Sessilibacter corallicola]|uniref:DUF924 family protein n=1 Tax=Sessilibacter corallicola TaxID=2904075 RepID=UPI001E2843A3|nr:DUF924 family protein [Sessilibacter corallicola]MCE2027286.1 DUF924 domain-containing protein [Sessilibacter corallicola]
MYQQVIGFWFSELEPKMWWIKDSEFDANIERRFGRVHRQAMDGELYEWRTSPLGALAEVLVLDQFSRNIFRDKPEAFACDSQALVLAQVAVENQFDEKLSVVERSFLYMPYMHSESKLIHEQAIILFTKLGNKDNLRFEQRHKDIVDRFGRYPHRNKILGRESTEEEIEFLKQPGSGF